MKIDKLYDEERELIQKQKEIINEMDICATQTFDTVRFKELAKEYNKVIARIVQIHNITKLYEVKE